MAKVKGVMRFVASNKLKYATERKSTHACRHYVDELKNRLYIELIGAVIAYIVATSGGTVRQMAPLNPAHRIGVTILKKEPLMALRRICERGCQFCGILDVFNY